MQYCFLVPILLILAAKYNVYQKLIFIGFGAVSCYLYFNPVGLVDIDRSLLSWAIFFDLGFAFYEAIALKSSNSFAILILLIVDTMIFAANNGKEIYTLLITMACISLTAMLLNLQIDYKFGGRD